jgi:hypothetical protein
LQRDEYGNIAAIHLSAKTGAGLADLRTALVETRDKPRMQDQVEEWHPLNDH